MPWDLAAFASDGVGFDVFERSCNSLLAQSVGVLETTFKSARLVVDVGLYQQTAADVWFKSSWHLLAVLPIRVRFLGGGISRELRR